MKRSHFRRRAMCGVLGAALGGVLVQLHPASAAAATATYNVVNSDSGHVTADALPTVQIDSGIVWTTAIAGDTVYAGGQFSNARPAGAASGTQLTPRSNLLAFSLSTGQLNTAFAPTVNGVVKSLALSPDKSILYIGGNFSQVNGKPRAQIAAISTSTGQLLPFNPIVNTTVSAIVATNDTVYFGGDFTQVNGQSRPYLAAATTAGALTTWAPVADYPVHGLALTPDGSRVIAGGSFSQINGVFSPSLASIDAVNGQLYPFAANQTIQNYGTTSAVWSLKSDGTNILATGYWFGGTGNFEGAAVIDPYSGTIRSMVDCHGDTYNATSMNGVLYTVSHHHDCSNVASMPQQNPNQWQRADSWTYDATGTVRANTVGGYHSFAGNPSSSEYDWFPTLTAGTVSGATQAAWTATASDGYLVLGGEFPSVNGVGQYGLVRFATPDKAPNKQGPVLGGNKMQPTLTVVNNAIKVDWPSNWDRDNQTLTYSVYRKDKGSTPIFTTKGTSQWWNMPKMGFLDTDLATNTAYTYQVAVQDAAGNRVVSLPATATTAATAISASPYAKAVQADNPTHYWRLTEPTGSSTSIDWAGDDDLTVGSGVTMGGNGMQSGSSDSAASFDGTDNGRAVANVLETGSDTLTVETWVRTTSTSGGKVVGFGNSQAGTSNNYDRQIYMDNTGHLIWGVCPNGVHTVSSPGTYNDGVWHHVAATLSSAGIALYVDGVRVAHDETVTSGQSFNGYWHLGGDNLTSWPNRPSSNNLVGDIDDTAIYSQALSQAQIRAHYVASGRSMDLPQRPADSYGATVFDDNPEFYWRLDEASGTVAHDATQNLANGTLSGGVSLAQTPAVAGTAAKFNGTNGEVYSNSLTDDPTSYSEEAWFDTTSTSGGKIIGLGNVQTGNSGVFDRHVYMDAQGHLNFGVNAAQSVVITSTRSYNDGKWHHVVATQGSAGMALYVDGVQVGANSTTSAQNFSGYWRVGGDSSWSGNGYFNGLIDEAAVYDTPLTIDQVRSHYRAAKITTNAAPTSSFTLTCDDYGTCRADASASADSDGTIASYAWSIDGVAQASTEQEMTAQLTAGTHTVSLTVTDDQGSSTTSTQTRTVTVTNRPPVSAFSSSCSATTCAFDGTLSSDPDGTVAHYAWDFGDGTTSTEATPTHTYAQAGSYNVTLTVTDNSGATAAGTKSVTVTPLVPPTAAFTSSSTALSTTVDASGTTAGNGTVTGYAWDFGDGATGTGRTASHTYAAAGTYTITLTVTDSHGQTDTVTHDVTVTKPNAVPQAAFTQSSDHLTLSVDASSSSDSDGTVASYAWDFGDGTTGTGQTASHTYTTAGTYTVSLTVTDNQGATNTTKQSFVAKAANQPPAAAFTASSSGLGVAFDGSASTDPDGTIATYAWDFGDGSTGTGRTASHSYAAAGTYTVLLTVTDDQGATNTVTRAVTVSATATAVASDDFARTTTGWGSAPVGGTYSYVTPSAFSVSNDTGRLVLAKAGAAPIANLPISAAELTYRGGFSIDKLDNGSGTYVQLLARRSASGEYRLKVRVQRSGAVSLSITKYAGGTETTLASKTLAGVTYVAGTTENLAFSVSGSTTVTLNATVWSPGTAQPTTPSMSASDSSSTLTSGSFAFQGYLSGSASNAPITVSFLPYSITGA